MNEAASPVDTMYVTSRVGRVVSVSGSQIITLLDNWSETDQEENFRKPDIGEVVNVRTSMTTAFGLVTGLSIPIPEQLEGRAELRIMELELIGEIESDGVFRRGVSVFPGLGDEVHHTSSEDLRRIFMRAGNNGVRIGVVHQDKTIPACVMVDELLGKHFAVLGTTGTGKSCAVSGILQSILAQHGKAHIVILDQHNEYATAFGDSAELISPSDLQLPYWLLNFEEMRQLIIGQSSQTPEIDQVILHQVIVQAKRSLLAMKDGSSSVSVDTPVPYRLSEVTQLLDEAMGKLDRPVDSAPYLRIREQFISLQQDRRFAFMFPGVTVRDNMAAILSRLFRIPVKGKPVTVIDTSGIPSEVLNVVVSLICRMTFDFALWSEQAVPILLVCEEAHRYAPIEGQTIFEPTKRALSRIAKEGRKYGVSLCLISQRPSELASSVLSQCNTIFALRMSNQKDQEFLRAAMPESGIGLLDELPSLRNAEAIAVGEGVPIPTRICFDQLPDQARPRSKTAPFSTAWTREISSENFMQGVVNRWRNQR
jgi:DNA helicase HerA-like ATPase